MQRTAHGLRMLVSGDPIGPQDRILRTAALTVQSQFTVQGRTRRVTQACRPGSHQRRPGRASPDGWPCNGNMLPPRLLGHRRLPARIPRLAASACGGALPTSVASYRRQGTALPPASPNSRFEATAAALLPRGERKSGTYTGRVQPPNAPAGWYADPSSARQLRYCDGDEWTDHTAPADAPPPITGSGAAEASVVDDSTLPCPYCRREIAADAFRCWNCGGEQRYCPRCEDFVGVSSHQKFVGMLRGGMKTQLRCLNCDRVVDGPRF
jgi:hypothetical protein